MAQIKLIQTAQHPSNLDTTAELLNGRSRENFSIFKVRGGFLFVTREGLAPVELLPTEQAARDAAEAN